MRNFLHIGFTLIRELLCAAADPGARNSDGRTFLDEWRARWDDERRSDDEYYIPPSRQKVEGVNKRWWSFWGAHKSRSSL